MASFCHRVLGALAAGLLGLAAPALAQEPAAGPPRISTTDLQILGTINGPGTDDPFLVATLQHFSTWKYGSNFFFADISGGNNLDPYQKALGVYLEYAPVFSLGRLGVLKTPQVSVLRDVGATVQINGGHTPEGYEINRVFLEGAELAWSVPRFLVFNTQLLARQERGYDPSWQFTWVYTLPFAAGPARGEITGFMDVWRRTSDDHPSSTVLLAQPQLLFNVGRQEPGQSFLQVGVELMPSHAFPVAEGEAGWNFAVSPMVRWVF